MKYILFYFVLFIFASCSSSYNDIYTTFDSEKSFSEDTYIVKTIKGFSSSKFLTVGAFCDGNEPKTNLLIEGEYYTVRRPKNIEEKDFIRKLEAIHGVCYACPNEKIEIPKVQVYDDSSVIRAFGLDAGNLDEDPDGKNYDYALRITQARNFYDENGVEHNGAYTEIGYGDNKVVLAIIDTGLNMKHPDFTRNGTSICLYAKSMYEDHIDSVTHDFKELPDFREVPIGSNEDGGGHGTHCSGSMCAVEGNTEGIAGVAYKNTFIISYKGLTLTSGSARAIYGALGDLAEIVSILKKEPGARTAEENAKIPSSVPQDFRITQKTVPCNMSLGSTTTSPYPVEMVNLAIANDILPVTAMGNDGRLKPAYPRSIYGCLPVGATDNKDKKAPFSEGGECISVTAPGFCIISTYNGDWQGGTSVKADTDTKGSQFMSGTSMAAPFVTGMLGYLLSFDEGQRLNSHQFKKLLEDTADKVDEGNKPFGNYENGHSLYYGYGRVNVLKAAKAITKKDGAVPIPEVDAFYLSKPLVITTPIREIRVRLYEVLADESFFPLSLSYTSSGNRKTHFHGLKKGVKYRVACTINGNEREYVFVANGGAEMEHSF